MENEGFRIARRESFLAMKVGKCRVGSEKRSEPLFFGRFSAVNVQWLVLCIVWRVFRENLGKSPFRQAYCRGREARMSSLREPGVRPFLGVTGWGFLP